LTRLFEAIEFAARAHAGQFRKGTAIPYIVHPLGVAKLLIQAGCSEEVVMAGVLHDTLEDTAVRREEIEERFGERVAGIVVGASEPDKSESWEARKRHTLRFLLTAPLEVALVACADKLDNIRSIHEDLTRQGESLWSRFNASREQQRWYYHSLATVLQSRLAGRPEASLAEALESEVVAVFGSP
jgi:(p)ppGpp synthase/HD superfamily hydrolase